jgi:threonine 3-dehydrogenase
LLGEDILITGAGLIGSMAAAIAKHAGARNIVVTDIVDDRLDRAKMMGATRTVNVAKEDLKQVMKELGIDDGFTIGFEMSGSPKGFDQLIDNMIMGGYVSLLGIPPGESKVNWGKIIFKAVTLKCIYGREMFRTWYKMSAMLESGLPLEKIITHKFKAEDFQKGFDLMVEGNCGKVVLEWD